MSDPYHVFRWLKREDRAHYAELMHETMAGKMRDLDRKAARLGVAAGEGVRAELGRMQAHLRGKFGG